MMELSIAARLLAEDVDVDVVLLPEQLEMEPGRLVVEGEDVAEEEQQLVLHAVVVVAVEDVAELLL